jgi:hypothetical protein
MRYVWALAAAAALFLGSYAARAADFDGSKPLVCAPMEIFECTLAEGCVRVTVEQLNIPLLFRMDFKKKTIHGKRVGGEEVNTPIRSFESGAGVTLVQGSEGGRAFSAAIEQATGKLSFTASGPGAGFALLGACVPD